MTFALEMSPAARRQLARLPKRIAPSIVDFLTTVLVGNPERVSKQLGGEFAGLRSARRGDYRVIFYIDADPSAVVVVRVAHRAHAYRPPAP